MNFLNLSDDAARAAASLGIDLGATIQKGGNILVKSADGVKKMSAGAFNSLLNSRAGSMAAGVADDAVEVTSRKLFPRMNYDHPPMNPVGDLGRFPMEGAYQVVEVPSIVRDVDDLTFVNGNQIGTKSGNPVFSTAKGDYSTIPEGKTRVFSGVAPNYASGLEEVTARENARKVSEALGGSNRLQTSAQQLGASEATRTHSLDPSLPTEFRAHIVPDVEFIPSKLGQPGNFSTTLAEKYEGIPTNVHGMTRHIPEIDETVARTNAMLSMADAPGRIGDGGNTSRLATYATDPIRLSSDIDLAANLAKSSGNKTNLTVRDDGTGSLSMMDRIFGRGGKGVTVKPGKEYQVTFAGSSPSTGGSFNPDVATINAPPIGATSAKFTYGDGGELAVPFSSVENGASGGHGVYIAGGGNASKKMTPDSLLPVKRSWVQKDQMFEHLGDIPVYQDAGVATDNLKGFRGFTSVGPKGANGVEVPLTRPDVIAITQDAMPGQMPSSAQLAKDDIVTKAAYFRNQQKDVDFNGKNLASSILPSYKGRLEYAQPLAGDGPISRAIPVLERGLTYADGDDLSTKARLAKKIMGDAMSIPPASLNSFSSDMTEITRGVFAPSSGNTNIKDVPNAAVGLSNPHAAFTAAAEYASKQVADAYRRIEVVGQKVGGRTQPVAVKIGGKSFNPLPMGEYDDAGRALGDKGSGVGKGDLSDYYRQRVAGVEDGGEFSIPPAWEGDSSPTGGFSTVKTPTKAGTRYTQVPDMDTELAQKFGGTPVEFQVASTLPGSGEALPFGSADKAQRDAARRIKSALGGRTPTDKESQILGALTPQIGQQHRPSIRVDNSGLASQRSLSIQDAAARDRVFVKHAIQQDGLDMAKKFNHVSPGQSFNDPDFDITLGKHERDFADEMDALAIHEQKQRDLMSNWESRNDKMDIVPEPHRVRLAPSTRSNYLQEAIEEASVADDRRAIGKLSSVIGNIRAHFGMGDAPGASKKPGGIYTPTGFSLPANGGRSIW